MTPPAAVLPRSTRRRPARFLLHALRPTARWVLRRQVTVTVTGAEHVPASGPVLLAGNHRGALDGPVMAIFGPRAVHALTKKELFVGPLGWALRAVGQIRLDRRNPDPRAVRSVLTVLRAGDVAGIFPEGTRGAGDFSGTFHRGAAYLALVTGAPVVPVTFIGSGPVPGSGKSVPPRGAHVRMVYGQPWQVPAQAWPRTKEQLEHHSTLLQQHLRAELARATVLVGTALDGSPDQEHPSGSGRANGDHEVALEEHHE